MRFLLEGVVAEIQQKIYSFMFNLLLLLNSSLPCIRYLSSKFLSPKCLKSVKLQPIRLVDEPYAISNPPFDFID